MHLKSLKVFCDVVGWHSFSRAAEENGISQSGASQVVNHLELHLGVKLIDRSKRPFVLTPEGETYHEGCRKLVQRYDALEDQVRTLHEAVSGRVRVVSIYSVGLHHMSRYLHEFLGQHPKANVRLEYQHPHRVYEAVERDQADLGLISYPRPGRTIETLPWREEPMVLVCAPTHRLAGRDQIGFEELAGEALIGFDPELTIQHEIDRVLTEHGVSVRIVMEFDNVETIKRAVEIDAGVALLPEPTVRREVLARSLQAVPLKTNELVRPLGIIHRRGKELGATTRRFIELLQAESTAETELVPAENAVAAHTNGMDLVFLKRVRHLAVNESSPKVECQGPEPSQLVQMFEGFPRGDLKFLTRNDWDGCPVMQIERTLPDHPTGLYDPAHEHDSCGVGFIVNVKGEKSHLVVQSGLEILLNLSHRGACGCDPLTGDGAGILLQLPDRFFRPVTAELGIQLPSLGDYAAGCVFLPRNPYERRHCERRLERLVAEEGQRFLGWRDVPTDSRVLGRTARAVEPVVRQVFIGRGEETSPDLFEWKLYVIRKRLEIEIRYSHLLQKKYCYISSLSSRTIIYKGLLLADQVEQYYSDLADERFESALVLVHQRYSTNTFPTWDLAHPFRFLAHNGEINTLKGNVNWMRARETMLASEKYGPDLLKIRPICTPNASDSATFDNVLELLVLTGRSLPQAMSMLIPEPWQNHETMSDDLKAYYEFQSCAIEPWDGPALMAFTDGAVIGACLDRNGLRPGRYWVTKNGYVIMASETGVLPNIPPEEVEAKGRLRPGRMLLIDTQQGRIIPDSQLKRSFAGRKPYRQWLNENMKTLSDLPVVPPVNGQLNEPIDRLLRAFGYTLEDLRIVMAPMATEEHEAIGSMGNDTPLAVLSDRPQLLYNYFKQLFAQVTNPPLDAIREEIVTSLVTTTGSEGNLLDESPTQCRVLKLDQPILTNTQLAQIKQFNAPDFRVRTMSTLFPRRGGAAGFKLRMDQIREEASRAIADGMNMLVLSDRGVDRDRVPIPALLACSGVHHHLIRECTRTSCSLIVESGEPREVHHFALLTGYGASAVNPYLALATLQQMLVDRIIGDELTCEKLEQNYIKAVGKGLLKVASKMGISTQASYRGAQIFEAVGLNTSVVEEYFTHTSSRIQGIDLETIAEESIRRHDHAFTTATVPETLKLDVGGQYQWRRKGEAHIFTPDTIATLQQATQINSREEFRKFCQLIDDQQKQLLTLRGLLEFKWSKSPVPLEEVESANEIVKRFATGAMSYGSISKEAHEMLAVAMNRMGGKSNTGEGGEDPARYSSDANGDNRNSAVKQVASGRFGVTSLYLVNAQELQIKIAQGAKPGEGGQLPGHKVDREIARIRHSAPGVGLISPPPHHDIYSIEDLSQLIHDLKNANHHARISVKLVAEVGVGTVAAGVAKGKADVVLISGQEGGTGASPLTAIKHSGVPWELGLAEAHQVLLMNDLRGRIIVQTDGYLRTARDVAIACLLGAEEWGIATGALVALGCIMMRKCHLNTCPVGIATQDPELRKKFAGKPEHVINYFFLLAEELRELMAQLGFRTINEMVGRVDRLKTRTAIKHWKAKGIDFSAILHKPGVPDHYLAYCAESQDHGLERSLDQTLLLEACKPALENRDVVKLELPIRNIHRTVGTMVSSEITRRFGALGLAEDTIQLDFRGSAGQSLGAFAVPGVTIRVEGDVNDYCGKGLSGGKIIVTPDRSSTFIAEENVIAGNVVLYGATSGEIYLRGIAGERFCVRNSGASAVVEGIGDHGCEYMTGGRVVVLGSTGRNFAAGMSGGIAYVLDLDGGFASCVNRETVELEELIDSEDIDTVLTLVKKHVDYTASMRGQWILDHWDEVVGRFVKVMPFEYRLAVQRLCADTALQQHGSPFAEVACG